MNRLSLSLLYRYVFYRLSRQQQTKLPTRREAAVTAAIFMCFTPMMLQGIVDIALSKTAGTTLLVDYLGKWPYTILVFGAIFVFHYVTLLSGKRAEKIQEEFADYAPYGKRGTWIAVAYFVIPFLMGAALVVWLES